MIEPNSNQHRTAAYALVLVAVLTTAVIAVQWVDSLTGRWLLPVIVAYFLFNGGYVFAVIKGRLQSRGAKIGLTAVLLNFAAMLLNTWPAIWTALSVSAVLAALIGGFVLLNDAKRVGGYSNSTIT